MPKQRDIGRRVDIQILRAVAVLSVIVGHFWSTKLEGGFAGVDVFFVISGFLITSLLVREIESDGQLNFARFWVRRIRRIFPAAMTVIIAVIVAVELIGAPDQTSILTRHVIASSFSGENLLLGWDSVDYQRSTDSTSPLQHYWSLAVEEQFYLVWPLVLGLVVIIARRLRLEFRTLAGWAVGAISVASLAYAIFIGPETPSNYFDPFARAWELGVGALVAIAFTRRTLRRTALTQIALLVAWIGLVASFFVPALAHRVPGIGVIPAVMLTAVIIALSTGSADRPPSTPAFALQRMGEWIGDRSYSMYLWHWPFVVLGPLVIEGNLKDWMKVACIAVVFVISDLSFRFIENPVRRSTRAWSNTPLAVGAIAVSLSLNVAVVTPALPNTSVTVGLTAEPTESMVDTPLDPSTPDYSAEYPYVSPHCDGAASAVFDCPATTAITVKASLYPIDPPASDTCVYYNEAKTRDCVLGDLNGARSIALVGDSHGRAMWRAFDLIGQHAHVRVATFLHNGCPYAASLNAECNDYNSHVRESITSGQYDLVVFVQRSTPLEVPADFRQVPDGYRAGYQELVDRGIPAVVLKDSPLLSIAQLKCIHQKFRDPGPCTIPIATAFETVDEAYNTAIDLGIPTIDLNPLFCPTDTCPAAIGGVGVYRDEHHPSTVFAATLAPFIWSDLRQLGFLGAK